MKKILTVLFLMAFVISACTAVPTNTDNYPATVIAMEVKIKLMEEAMKATSQAIENEKMVPTLAQPTLAPCATCAPATLVVTATQASIPTETPNPSATKAATGSISGALNYPSSYIPAQRVIAFNLKTGYWYWQNTTDGTASYSFEKLPAGSYHVLSYLVANPKTLVAGYSQAVPCGLLESCTDHSLIDVEVKAGEETKGVNVFDWYAELATAGWPADPTQN
jgi:hypothetical protein